MRLIPKIASKVYKLGSLNSKFGDPRRLPVVILLPVGDPIVIDPIPEVTRVTPQQLEQFNTASILVKPTDWVINEIPRFKYSDTNLIKGRYLIDAMLEPNGRYTGQAAEFRHLDDSDPLYYKVVIAGHLMR